MTSTTEKIHKMPASKERSGPLLEAIFEVRWQLMQIPNTPALRDPGYPLIYGRLYDKFKGRYPIVEDLPTTQLQAEANPFVVRHRIRKGKEEWPLVQIGPGILTVNAAAEYKWASFKEDACLAFEGIRQFFPSAQLPLKFLKAELRFINGYPCEGSPAAFLSEKLHTKVELDPALFPKDRVAEKQEGLLLNVGYQLNRPAGQGMLSFSLGQSEGKPAIIQQSLIQSVGENAPQDLSELSLWLEEAHALAKIWFATLSK